MNKLFLYIVLIFFSLTGFSQTVKEKIENDTETIAHKKFEQEKIDHYKKSDEFIYVVEKSEPSILEKIWNWCKRVLKKILSYLFDDISPAVGFLKIVFKTLPYIIATLVLYFIMKFFLKVNARNIFEGKNKKTIIKITDEEELIKDKNLPNLIKTAIIDKNYNLAIRYYYLLTIKKLSENEIILWQQEKTNEDYIREISSHKNISNDFKELTYIYDYAWYGEFIISHEKFLKAEIKFNNLITKI